MCSEKEKVKLFQRIPRSTGRLIRLWRVKTFLVGEFSARERERAQERERDIGERGRDRERETESLSDRDSHSTVVCHKFAIYT